jgi:hypothetical protein
MLEITQAVGMITLFIRYNPDPYTTNKKKYDPSQEKRHKKLINWIITLMQEPMQERIINEFETLAIYLFYDGYQENCVNIEKIKCGLNL